jgi:hypothetical protein
MGMTPRVRQDAFQAMVFMAQRTGSLDHGTPFPTGRATRPVQPSIRAKSEKAEKGNVEVGQKVYIKP